MSATDESVRFPETVSVSLPEGTIAWLNAHLSPGESLSNFCRVILLGFMDTVQSEEEP